MKTKQQLLDEKVGFPYYLGYSHYVYGLHLWRKRSEEGDINLPGDFLDPFYREGYDNARHDVTEAFDANG